MQTAEVRFNCGTTSAENYFLLRGRTFQNVLYRMIHLEVMHGIFRLAFFCSYLKSRDMESAGEKTPDCHACLTITSVACLWVFIFTWTLNQRGCFAYVLPRGKPATPFGLFGCSWRILLRSPAKLFRWWCANPRIRYRKITWRFLVKNILIQ